MGGLLMKNDDINNMLLRARWQQNKWKSKVSNQTVEELLQILENITAVYEIEIQS